jgi:ABC-type multidrug transport system fused ATPase/permease subunit
VCCLVHYNLLLLILLFKAFTIMTLFQLMTMPFIFLPYGLQMFAQCQVSMKRICQFLGSAELEGYVTDTDTDTLALTDAASGGSKEGGKVTGEEVAIEFKGADLCWTPEEEKLLEKIEGEGDEDGVEGGDEYTTVSLKEDKQLTSQVDISEVDISHNEEKEETATATNGNDDSDDQQQLPSNEIETEPQSKAANKTFHTLVGLDLKIKRGQLVGIVGTVGCGKSSVLMAILGEMHLKAGSVAVKSEASIAYCDQRPFVVNATLKDNIVFHKEYDEERFNKVIDVVCMQDDVKLLSHGVMTEIGERGN